jgi:hypothetical protein
MGAPSAKAGGHVTKSVTLANVVTCQLVCYFNCLTPIILEGSQGAVEQRLWLDTQPTLNLLSDDLGVIGCGVVAHGLTHDALEKGQNDNGTCSSMLSQTCIQSILNATSEAAHGTTTAGSSASEICANFENLQQNQMSGLPSECSASFVKGAWLQSFGRVLIIYISVRPSITNTKQRYSLCIPSS